MKYRLVKRTQVGGFVTWVIQKQAPWFLRWLIQWEFVDCLLYEKPAREKLALLRAGFPEQTEEVMGDIPTWVGKEDTDEVA